MLYLQRISGEAEKSAKTMATNSGAFAPQNGLPSYCSGLETTSAGGFCSLDSPDTTLAGVGLEPTASGL